ncbi:MAG: gliding motility-associated C-terminal domain-containing protein, partial [Bacteroidetes bacterium]|nr:gliding motility-associated C-terminal domain-containing protein [Bacteroidota bacterium]
SGVAPFDFVYTDGTTSFPINTNLTTYTFTVNASGTYTLVSVNDANNCGGSVSGSAIVTEKPQPIVTVNSPSICEGESTTVTASPNTAGGTYQWTAPAAVAGATTPSLTVTPANTTTYDVTYTLNGCSNTGSGTVTVNSIPTLTMTGDNICDGEQATITATGNPAGGNYLWLSPASVTNQTTASVNDSPSSDQTYTVEYTLNGCSVQGTADVIVTPTPIVSVSPQNPSICQGENITLTAISTLNGGTYVWTPAQTPSNATVTVSPATTTTYSVIHTVNGCPSNSASTTVTVNPAPTATAGSNSPICEGEDLMLTGNNVPGATYSWTGPNGFKSRAEDTTLVSAQPNQSGTYVLTITANGCSSVPSTTSVQIGQYQNASINPAGPFCSDAPVATLTAASPNGSWSGPGITNAANGTFDPDIAGPGTHTITYEFFGNCPSSSTRDIVVNETPNVSFSADQIEACTPASIEFTSTITPTPTSVSWDFGDGGQSTVNGNVTHEYLTSGVYTVTLTATLNGCTGMSTQNNYITINQSPVAGFDAEVSGSLVSFQNSSTGASSYLWDFDNGSTSTETNPSVSLEGDDSSFDVQLVAYADNGCTDTLVQTIQTVEEVIFYVPNAFTPDGDPMNQYFLPVMTQGFEPASYTFKIYNRWGEPVFESKDVKIGWDGTYNNQIVGEGLYTWTIKFTDIETDKKYTFQGNVNLLK